MRKEDCSRLFFQSTLQLNFYTIRRINLSVGRINLSVGPAYPLHDTIQGFIQKFWREEGGSIVGWCEYDGWGQNLGLQCQIGFSFVSSSVLERNNHLLNYNCYCNCNQKI